MKKLRLRAVTCSLNKSHNYYIQTLEKAILLQKKRFFLTENVEFQIQDPCLKTRESRPSSRESVKMGKLCGLEMVTLGGKNVDIGRKMGVGSDIGWLKSAILGEK